MNKTLKNKIIAVIISLVVICLFILVFVDGSGIEVPWNIIIPISQLVIAFLGIIGTYNAIKEKWSISQIVGFIFAVIILIATVDLYSLHYGPGAFFLLFIFSIVHIMVLTMMIMITTGKLK